jgi:uroporphyrinogen-III synthase
MSLAGKTIVVTRGEKVSQAWIKSLANLGANVYNLPTITMSPVDPDGIIISTLRDLDSFDWLVFTSASGVGYFFGLYSQLGIQHSVKKFPLIAVIGSRTATEVLKVGFKVTFEPSLSDSKHLARELDPVNHKRILLLRTTIASDDLPEAFKKRGAKVSDLRIYKTDVITDHDPSFSMKLHDGTVDFITFASPSAVAGFVAQVGKNDLELAKNLSIVAIGPSVVQALVHAGFTNVHMAKTASIDGVIKTLNRLAT